MLKLIRLELRKNKFNFLKSVLIADLAILGFMVLIAFTEMDEGSSARIAICLKGCSFL